MSKNKDYIAEANAKSAMEASELDSSIDTDGVDPWRGSFLGVGRRGLVLSLLLVLGIAGVAIWAFGWWDEGDVAALLIVAAAIAFFNFLFVSLRTPKSKNSVSLLSDFVASFWTGVFPMLLIGAIAVFALAMWLGVSFKIALGILVVVVFLLVALANQ